MDSPPKSLAEIEEERRREEEERKRREEEERKRKEEEEEKRLKEEAERRKQVAIAEAKIKAMEAIKKQEENYERIQAENRIAQLPREERELKLAMIRGDKLSPKTFEEVKNTAIGLHGSLQGYIEEVNKIPVGSVTAVSRPSETKQNPVPMSDPDSVDLGDE